MDNSKAQEVHNAIEQFSATLSFMREYFEANNIKLDNLPVGSTVDVLNGAKQT